METATHFLPMKDGKTPQMYYRVTEGKYNTGEKFKGLQYFSSFGSWQGTNESDVEKYINEKLVEIPNWKPFLLN